MLTPKQLELLEYIDWHIRETATAPSFDEMAEHLNLKSKQGIHRMVTGLEERGFIRRIPHRARAIEVIKLPEALRKKAFEIVNVDESSDSLTLKFNSRSDRQFFQLKHGKAA